MSNHDHHGMKTLEGLNPFCSAKSYGEEAFGDQRDDRFGRLFPELRPAYTRPDILEALGTTHSPQRFLDFMIRAGAYGDHFGKDPEGWTLAKLKERRHEMTTEAFNTQLAELHTELMKLGEWWIGQEEDVFRP